MIEVCHESNVLCLRANCLPEMKKDRVYKLVMKLDSWSFKIDEAQCGCPAGCGPKASCKHIAALCMHWRSSPDYSNFLILWHALIGYKLGISQDPRN